jgi:excisionase family DNA binding protein
MDFSSTIGSPPFPPLIRPLTKKELAEFLVCSERFIETEVVAGRLRKIILGTNRVRFLPKDVNAWLEKGASLPTGRRRRKASIKAEFIAK